MNVLRIRKLAMKMKWRKDPQDNANRNRLLLWCHPWPVSPVRILCKWYTCLLLFVSCVPHSQIIVVVSSHQVSNQQLKIDGSPRLDNGEFEEAVIIQDLRKRKNKRSIFLRAFIWAIRLLMAAGITIIIACSICILYSYSSGRYYNRYSQYDK